MTDKIRVLEMIDRPFLGGGQVHLLSIAAHLDRDLFEPLVAAQGGGPLEVEARKAGLTFIPIPFRKAASLRLIREISRILTEVGIGILHTHGGVAGLFGRLAAQRAGVSVVVHTVHGIHYLHYRNPVLKAAAVRLERRLSRRTAAVIFVSEADFSRARRLRLAPPAVLRLIKNGIDLADLQGPEALDGRRKNLRAALKLAPPVVGAVSRLHRQKGLIHLLHAAPHILAHCPGAKIVVVGGGPLEKDLRHAARVSGLDRHVVLLGERPDARDLLALFDVFVLPSLWEGLPLALIEAASLGKPIVASDIDGIREVLRDGKSGILVPPGDPVSLAEAVVRLIRNPELAGELGRRAQAAIPPLYTLKRMVEETQRLYLELWAAKTAGR